MLPNLVTTADEVTIFATLSTINYKDSFYIVSKPDKIMNEFVRSGYRKHYKKNPTGDTHCMGVQIVLNSTFARDGLTTPLFVTIYCLTKEEIPKDDSITYCRFNTGYLFTCQKLYLIRQRQQFTK